MTGHARDRATLQSAGYTDMPFTASSITKQHFTAVAAMFRDAAKLSGSGPEGVAAENMRLAIAVRLARLYEVANHSFDRTRFLKACNPIPAPRRGKGVTAAVKSPQNSPKPERTDHDDADRYGAFPRAD